MTMTCQGFEFKASPVTESQIEIWVQKRLWFLFHKTIDISKKKQNDTTRDLRRAGSHTVTERGPKVPWRLNETWSGALGAPS